MTYTALLAQYSAKEPRNKGSTGNWSTGVQENAGIAARTAALIRAVRQYSTRTLHALLYRRNRPTDPRDKTPPYAHTKSPYRKRAA